MPDIPFPATARLVGQTVNCRFDVTPGSWGTTPATLTLVAPENAFDAVSGQVSDLRVECDGVEGIWRDCLITYVGASRPANAGLWEVKLEDRRWRSAHSYPYIDGDFNDQQQIGAIIREKTPRELATLLAAAMGEPALDVSRLPNGARPRKTWRASNPRDELDKLCNDLGCAIVFDALADRAKIVRVGQGQDIPPGPYVSFTEGRVLPHWPSQIRVVGGPALFQTLLWLEAVGEDIDGKIKPIDELLYRPADGWRRMHPRQFINLKGTYRGEDGAELYVRDLAEKSVYRWYRIAGQARIARVLFRFGENPGTQPFNRWSPDALKLPNPDDGLGSIATEFSPTSLDDLGPFLTSRLERSEATGERLPAIVFGDFWDSRREKKTATKIGAQWPRGWSFNQKTKCVELSDPAWIYDDTPGQLVGIIPARLYFLCAYACSKNGVPIRYEKFRNNDGPDYRGGTRNEHHEEIVREVVERGALGNPDTDNLAQCDAEADFYLDAINAEYQVLPTAQIELPLLERFTPDGVLRQIRWSAGAEGPAPSTQLSFNTELSNMQPDYRDTPQQRAKRVADQAARERDALEGRRSNRPFPISSEDDR